MEAQPITVSIDRSQCIGTGNCVTVAPRVFRLDESMKAVVLDPEGDPLQQVLDAAEVCPTQAIYVSEGETPLFP